MDEGTDIGSTIKKDKCYSRIEEHLKNSIGGDRETGIWEFSRGRENFFLGKSRILVLLNEHDPTEIPLHSVFYYWLVTKHIKA